jgi:hypothetical protein
MEQKLPGLLRGLKDASGSSLWYPHLVPFTYWVQPCGKDMLTQLDVKKPELKTGHQHAR